MKHWIPLIRKSAKKSFKLLRERSPFFCTYLEEEVKVTKLFFDHIAYKKKRHKNPEELATRLLISPFVDEILKEGLLQDHRREEAIEYFKISKKFGHQTFSVIVQKRNQQYYLISCFLQTQKIKKDLS